MNLPVIRNLNSGILMAARASISWRCPVSLVMEWIGLLLAE
jgi:hypothetical protein